MTSQQQEVGVTKEEEEDAKVMLPTVLACSACNLALVGADDLIADKYPGIKQDAVYAYELDDICGRDGITTYSATNPSERRFDVIRVKAIVAERGNVECRGRRPSADHSWFVPYCWNMASCVKCGASLGWGFYEAEAETPANGGERSSASVASGGDSEEDDSDEHDEASEGPSFAVGVCDRPLQFIGLIVTSCVARNAQLESAEELTRLRVERDLYFELRHQAMCRLRAHTDQAAANAMAMLIVALDATPDRWPMAMPELLLSIASFCGSEDDEEERIDRRALDRETETTEADDDNDNNDNNNDDDEEETE